MNPTVFELGVAILMVVVSVSLTVRFWRYMAAASERRTIQMWSRAGVAPDVTRQVDIEAIIKDVRSRCRRCRSEGLCERWLAGQVVGDNRFCPNAQIFRGLAKTSGRAALLSP